MFFRVRAAPAREGGGTAPICPGKEGGRKEHLEIFIVTFFFL